MKYILSACLLLFCAGISAQQDTVPDMVLTKSNFEKVLVVRLKPGTDMIEGLKKAVEKEKIQNAVILSGIGSVKQFTIHSVASTTFPTKNEFVTEKGGYDILSMNGYIIKGKVHTHIAFSDLKKTIGGHLEPGTTVYTFAIITIGVLDASANLENFDNWKWR